MKHVLRFIGFGSMVIGIGGMAEMEKMHIALILIIVGALALGLDSILEDVEIEKRNRNHSIGIIASYPSYLSRSKRV